MTLRPAAATLLLVAAILPAGASAATVWTAVASEKIRPEEPARSTTTASIAAAKNEFESFQIVVTGPAHVESATASDLTGPGTISGLKLFREELVTVVHPSALDGGTGRYPDPLVPDVDDVVGEKRNAFPFDAAANESRAIWVDVFVPPDAPPGAYDGSVVLRVDGKDVAVPVHLVVWDFSLPSTPSLKSAFGLGGGVAIQHPGLGPDALSTLRARYAQLALDHRVSLHDVSADMSPPMDWQRFDAFYGPLLDGTAATRLAGARLTSVSTNGDPASVAQNADWARHFRSRGWFGALFQYTCDEPPLSCSWSDVIARAQAAKAADPALRTLVTTNVEDATTNGASSAIDMITPLVNEVDDRTPDDYSLLPGGNDRPSYDAFLAQPGKELWLYESCMSDGCGGTVNIGNALAPPPYFVGWPSYMVDASSVRARALEWFSFRYGGSGELYYETIQAYYARDPWTGGLWDFDGNGDGTLFYPGTPAHIGGQTDIPVASIRLKMIREGMEDFEYLDLLSRLGDPAGAHQIADRLFVHPYRSDVSVADLMAARQEIADRILQLLHEPVPAAGDTSLGAPATAATSAGGAPRAASGGCGTSAPGTPTSVATRALLPLALVLQRLRMRRR